jgi:Arc/MetJ-type ribon-helix-helix transcriptional regulator
MVRTQIQLTEEQSGLLKRMAAEEGVSVAEVIRIAVDRLAASRTGMTAAERRRRALAAAGRFSSDAGDLAEKHDQHLARAYRK